MFPCPGYRVNITYEWISTCAASQFSTRVRESQRNSANHYCAERPNHTAMTYTSKRIATSRMVSHIRHNNS